MLFLNSTWLFAIAALSIPVAIHLWNIKQGKTLKVGSIALINEAAQKSSRSLKLHDLLLLLLRCLLLLLLALLLAVPVWQHSLSSAKTKGWLLIPKENISESLHKFSPLIDSLTKAGYELHYFNKGFTKDDLKKLRADTSPKDKPQADDPNYWNMVSMLGQQLPATIPVYLITPNGASHFSGNKPSVALNLRWKTYIANDSVSTWIEKAWFTNNNDIKVIQGSSKPSGTVFATYTIASGAAANSLFEVGTANGNPTVKLKNSGQSPVIIDTATLRLAVYTDKYNADAGYLKAALQAIANFSKLRITVKQYTNAAQIPAGQNWLFWLSDKPVDATTQKKAINIFQYGTGKVGNANSWIKTNGYFAAGGQQNIALFKLIAGADTAASSVWQDGFGNPVLSITQAAGQTNNYHFYSHLNPAWNNLVWSDVFPQLLFKLIIGRNVLEQGNKYDRRAMDEQQLMPYHTEGTTIKTTEPVKQQTDLSRYFWLAMMVVFVTERWLANRNKQVLKNG
ncbi:N-terminal double-transmembrane domain-containing protein [Mucilaginibacter pineti]|uniref:N-terminal double-transmembrane domain-containing protein n=1 Tax=Mucilaginibacter pineti TaxID=1391627 RepID=A0A1G6X6W2_9SPHI|nr:BatA domain-containing protein [Mucilaginibacter pineti]SDD73901.1 N-terminal double-transmembrane domain-containing protein [Mucilaginibacter pineti]